MREAAWQAQVVELAGYYRWWVFHPFDSRRSEPGWPDLTLVRAGELIWAELKTDKGRLTPAQVAVGERLAAVAALAPNVYYYVWRPRDFEAVHARLRKLGQDADRVST